MSSDLIFKILGALGLVFITIGVLTKERIRENILFIVGGLLLEVYSVHLGDMIFIPLQVIFVVASVYEVYELKKKKKPFFLFWKKN
jgi:Ca2+/Na+ antiporter